MMDKASGGEKISVLLERLGRSKKVSSCSQLLKAQKIQGWA